MPTISVIIPAYNAEKYIVKCLESLCKQTFQDWEAIVVNDGSKDQTRALCDQCAAEDERIRVIHLRKNAGVSNARNVGLSNAAGKYIAFLDADDRYEFHSLQTMWDLMQEADADTVACGHLYLWPNGAKATRKVTPAKQAFAGAACFFGLFSDWRWRLYSGLSAFIRAFRIGARAWS